MKRVIGLFLFLEMAAVARIFSETTQITRADFENYLHYEAPSASLSKSWESFVVRKLKVADAMSKGWDTIPSFMQLCKSVQGKALKSYLLSRHEYESSKSIPQTCCYLLEQWVIPIPQNVSRGEEKLAVHCMDSCFSILNHHKSGEIPTRVQHSIAWYTDEVLLNEFRPVLSALSDNELSRPFLSPVGVHVIRVLRKENRTSSSVTVGEREEADWDNMQTKYGELSELNPDLRARLLGVRDSLLAVCWDYTTQEMLNDTDYEETKLDAFFQENRHHYHWELPHFKGAVIHSSTQKMASRLKKQLKKHDISDWDKVLTRFMEEHPDAHIQLEYGLFQIGKNPYVDKLAFKCGELPASAGKQYVTVYGKRLKKGPDSYRDVYELVVRDYKKALYAQQIQDLKERFPLDFDAEVLKTVNCCGSN